ncbi:MAG: CRISPR-associated helicase Cas3' [Aquabacterium sp.]
MPLFTDLSPAARSLWAKSGDDCGHGLVAHMLDVAAVALEILNLEPVSTRQWVGGQLGLSEELGCAFVAKIVGLHDLGKAIPGFQSKWAEGQAKVEESGLRFSAPSLQQSLHDLASAAFVRRLLAQRGFSPSVSMALAQSISAHHGYNFLSASVRDGMPHGEFSEWKAVRQELFDSYWKYSQETIVSVSEEFGLPFVQWLAGLTTLSDWIGSNPDWFPFGERAESFEEHFTEARKLARHALEEIGWHEHKGLLFDESFRTDELISRIIGLPGVRARPLQAGASTLLDQTEGQTLLIVEAPMGEGKTELAFLAHLRLQNQNQHRGLYVALPTQATGNAMFDRAIAFLRAFGSHEPIDIQLAHGGAMFDDRVHALRGIYGGKSDDAVTSSAWFAKGKRSLLSPYGVGTVDQALFATLNVKHHFVRLWGLSNKVVVLDEVHAYDTYTSGLIEALLRWLKALNCSVVLMSATLPAARRAALLRAWRGSDLVLPEYEYPRILACSEQGISGISVESRAQAPIQVTAVSERLPDLANEVMSKVSEGGCGVVIVNTVNRAQELYALLKEHIEDDTVLMLFHARFPADERRALEQRVMKLFGRAGSRPQRAVLIATQVVEQSLDIDFDFMISDLAPIDLLLQRAGRLHRHERSRPAVHSVPQFQVAGLNPTCLPELKQTAWGFVYDPYVLYRTWAFASRESVWQLPWDIDRLVQAVYGSSPLPDDLASEERDAIEVVALGEHLAIIQNEKRQSLLAAIDPDAEPQAAYTDKPKGNEDGDGLGIRNQTRLGDDSVAFVPVHVTEDGWRLKSGDAPFDPAIAPAPDLAKRIFERQVKLSRKAVVAHANAIASPKGFIEHPLLRNLKPLLLINGVLNLGKLTVSLDEEYGVRYASTDT